MPIHLIGLLGGVASGKSLVARELARLGAGLLDADRAGHEALGVERVKQAVRKHWGPGVFGADGEIDRARLSRIVFAAPPDGPRERRYLEQITHPEIGRILHRQAGEMASLGVAVAVLDAPLLIEAGWDHCCDTLVFVDAPRELRLTRARKRGWSEEEFAAREEAQESLDVKRKRAHLILDNSGSVEQVRAQVERFWRTLVG
ncbi:MAG TPA: dephospho-CoA kinase [Planctomycetaceae bacterium]|nr:dephospho-CoA kinase [Planctomycetaceae bacterium]HIQ23211.1 dephospho-CoA kinase [Planctomycetota bacterium]